MNCSIFLDSLKMTAPSTGKLYVNPLIQTAVQNDASFFMFLTLNILMRDLRMADFVKWLS